MSKQLNWLVNGFYGAFSIADAKPVSKKKTKTAGTYSSRVNTDSRSNLRSSAIKVGNAMRKVAAEV